MHLRAFQKVDIMVGIMVGIIDSTSAHGLNHVIFRPAHWSIKIFWIVTFCTSVSFVVWQFWQLMTLYASYPKLVDIEVKMS